MAAEARRARSEKGGPERLCIATREERPPDELIRFVVGPEGALVPDLRRKLPGRGVWVTATAQAVAAAMKKKAFGRSLKGAVTVPPTLIENIDALLERDALQALSFANKAGEAVTGFVKVEAAIDKGIVVALLQAREAAPDGVRKLAQALRRRGQAVARKVETIGAFRGADLDLALGGAHVIHAALASGPASAGFLARWRRLARFRGLADGAGAGASGIDDETAGVSPQDDNPQERGRIE